MIRAVLDANVYVSALIRPDGPPGRILSCLLKEQSFELVVTEEILEELRASLSSSKVQKYIRATAEELDLFLAAISLVADEVEGSTEVRVVNDDPDDDKYLAAAVDGRAGFIVTGDTHLLNIEEYEGIRILTPRFFLHLLKTVPEIP